MLKSEPLYYLCEVGKHQSLSIAAEKLHVTQPTLSIAIKNLENELDLKLIERMYHGVYLTAEGEKIVALAEQAFDSFKEIEKFAHERSQQHQKQISLPITVYSTSALNSSFLPYLIKRYYELYPTGTFNCYPLNNQTPDEILMKNPDSFVFVIINENRTFSEEINIIPLDKSNSYLAMHATADFFPPEKKNISLKELLNIPLITTTTPEEQAFQSELLSTLKKYGSPNIRFTSSNMEMTSSLIEQKLGASLYLSFKHVKNYHTPTFRSIKIKNAPKFILALLYNKNTDQKNLDFFSSFLKENL